MSVQKVSACLFDSKPKPSEASLESPELENIPQLPGNRAEVGQYHDLRKVVGYSFSLRVKWGYISGEKPESERSKSFAVFISLQTKAIRS